MSMSDVIAHFAAGATYTVTRTAAGTLSAGDYTAGSESTFSIEASIQPNDNPLKIAPEGHQGADVMLVLTTTELFKVPHPDRIAYKGATWKVFDVERWEAFGEAWTRAWIARQDVP